MIADLVHANRSCRRFYENHLVDGKVLEEIVIETVETDGSIRYWRDSQGVHHVPKRPLQEIIVASHLP